MKKYFLLTIIFLTSLFVTPTYAQPTKIEESIVKFNSKITVNQDATIDVREEIHYYFDSRRHGILWQYPIEYDVSGFKRSTGFDLNEVYYYPEGSPDRQTSEYEMTKSRGWVELKIGEPDRTLIGTWIYVVDYTLTGVGISYFDTHDEVYFNVIGPGWQVPIYQANAEITTFMEPTDRICYTGKDNVAQGNCEFSQSNDELVLSTTETLQPYEGLTFALKFPSGSIEDRSTQVWFGLILSNLGILLPIPVTIFLLSLLKKKWSNEEITVIPHYEVPEDLDPLIAGYVYKGKHEAKHLSATIIWMATKGYLSIKKEGKKTYLYKEVEEIEDSNEEISNAAKLFSNSHKESLFNIVKDTDSHIQDLFKALFSKKDSVNVSSMSSSFNNKVAGIFSTASRYSNYMGYIDKGKTNTKGQLTTLGIFIAFAGFIWLTALLSPLAAIGTGIGVGISGIIVAIVGSKIDIKTEAGNKLYYELEGLKMYIDTAEKHRIEFHNDPEKFRGVFETLLPFAMVFGLEKKWAKEFEDLYKDTQPDWYRGDFSAFDVYMISSAVNSLNRSVKTSTSKAYGSSSGFRSSGWSSGGSGFSGGSSGGGGGGSGGGSW